MTTRTTLRAALAAALGLAILSGCGSSYDEEAYKQPDTSVVTQAANTPAARMLEAINEARKAKGLRPLTAESRLMRAAAEHATDMADQDYFDHKGSDGSNFAARVTREGYVYRFVGENIAAGLPSAKETVEAWITSPEHSRNVFASEALHAGIGYAYRPNDGGKADYRYYWVLTVGCDAEAQDKWPSWACQPQKPGAKSAAKN